MWESAWIRREWSFRFLNRVRTQQAVAQISDLRYLIFSFPEMVNKIADNGNKIRLGTLVDNVLIILKRFFNVYNQKIEFCSSFS